MKRNKDNFAAFILTHGRPDNVITYQTLKKSGYTGKIYFIIDNEDKRGDEYRSTFFTVTFKIRRFVRHRLEASTKS